MRYDISYYLNSTSLFATKTKQTMKIADQIHEQSFSVRCTLVNLDETKQAILHARQLGATQFEIRPLNADGAIICLFMFDKHKYTGVLSTVGKSALIKPFKELFGELFPKK